MITDHDILDVVVEEANEDILKQSGTYEIEEENHSPILYISCFIPLFIIGVSSLTVKYYSMITFKDAMTKS